LWLPVPRSRRTGITIITTTITALPDRSAAKSWAHGRGANRALSPLAFQDETPHVTLS